MKKLNKTFLYLILIILITPLAAHSKMYMWTDENGVKHYSNTPPPQNAKNIQEKKEQKFDEEKYQRLMEQKKAYEAQIAEEVEANRVLEAEMNKIKEKEVLQRRKQQKRKNLANKFFGTITKKKAVLCPHLTIWCGSIFSKNRRRYHEHRAT